MIDRIRCCIDSSSLFSLSSLNHYLFSVLSSLSSALLKLAVLRSHPLSTDGENHVFSLPFFHEGTTSHFDFPLKSLLDSKGIIYWALT